MGVGSFTPGKETRNQLGRRLGGPQSRCGQLRKISLHIVRIFRVARHTHNTIRRKQEQNKTDMIPQKKIYDDKNVILTTLEKNFGHRCKSKPSRN